MDKILVSELKMNEDNPRYINEYKMLKLVKSIQEFPEMLEKRPIVVDEDMIVLGGNMRLQACIKAGLKEVPVIVAEGWSEEKKREFIIKDNVGFGEWDWDALANEWDTEELEDWGLDIPGAEGFGDDEDEDSDSGQQEEEITITVGPINAEDVSNAVDLIHAALPDIPVSLGGKPIKFGDEVGQSREEDSDA